MLTRSGGQLRLAPNAAIVAGLDLCAALAVGAALHYDPVAIAELLPSGEAGMMAAIETRLNAVTRPTGEPG